MRYRTWPVMALKRTPFHYVLLSTCKALELECKVNKCWSVPEPWPAFLEGRDHLPRSQEHTEQSARPCVLLE